ncbi:ABC transporter ATP-binding protein [Allopusillimonas ginsengisoli]|uniref:ABC transporter ATP-binding protein n=1 Tax=Allopusillimonas ginsengisoli TaxID=453575 RepID=UPI00101FF142|nr:ABC transporter ATP-binding protein [Allopusillimonas ginsengisoli]TEA79004.1 ABC transporter ATP-binding protein [Allopusillimonas ginsengisoli]
MDNKHASLTVKGLSAGYGAIQVLSEVSLDADSGQTTLLLGTNGNGKSTVIRCIMGMLPANRGTITANIDGNEIDLLGLSTQEIVELGIVLVPEGRRLFPQSTVEENLLLGAFPRHARAARSANLEVCYSIFGRLAERRRQVVSTMSGGEQQMVALGRALMSSPRLLIIDEPSVGLAPILVTRTMETIAKLKASLGLTVLMAEQSFHQASRIADAGYVLVHGKIELEACTRTALNNSDLIRRLYFGA